MATSLRCRVSAISAFCQPTTQSPLHNQLPSRYRSHKNQLIAILVPKLVAMATSLSTAGPHLTHDSCGHSNQKLKRHLDRFSRFRTGARTVSLYFTMRRPFPPQNRPFPRGIWTPFNNGSFGPPESSTQTTSRSVQPFFRAH